MKEVTKLLIFDVISTFGSKIFAFSVAFYILGNTDQTYLYSIHLFLIVLSTVTSAPVIGTFTDRFDNKRFALFAQSSSVIVLAVLLLIPSESIIIALVLISVFLTIADAVTGNIVQVNLVNVSGDYLERVVSFRQVIITAISFLAPIIGGMLFAFISIKIIVVIIFILEVLSLIIFQTLKLQSNSETDILYESTSFLKEIKEGLNYLIKEKNIFIFMMSALALNFFMNALVVGVPIVAVQKLNLSSYEFGFIESSLAISLFLSSIIFTVYPIRKNLVFTFNISMVLQFIIIFSLGLYLISNFEFISSFVFLILIYLALGFSITLNNIPYSIYMQKNVPMDVKGRVFSLNQSFVQLITPLSMLIFGLFLNNHSSKVFVLCALGVLLTIIIFNTANVRLSKNIKLSKQISN